jgi:hypothetical protein
MFLQLPVLLGLNAAGDVLIPIGCIAASSWAQFWPDVHGTVKCAGCETARAPYELQAQPQLRLQLTFATTGCSYNTGHAQPPVAKAGRSGLSPVLLWV